MTTDHRPLREATGGLKPGGGELMKEKMHSIRRRLFVVAVVAFSALALPAAAFAQTMPTGSDGTTTLGDTFTSSVTDFGTLVVDLAPALFAGLITVLLIRLAIKWFRRVAKSV